MKTSEDLKKICLGKSYKKTIELPYSDEEFLIDMSILSSRDVIEAEAAASSYMEAKKLSKLNDAYLIESHCQVLYRCCYEHGSSNRFFKNIEDVRDLPAEMTIYLAGQYTVLSEELALITEDMNEQQIEEVKKKLSNGVIPIGLSYPQLLLALMALGGFKSTEKLDAKSALDAVRKNLQNPNSQSTSS